MSRPEQSNQNPGEDFLTGIRSQMERSPHGFTENLEYRILLYEIAMELQQGTRFFEVYDAIEARLQTLLRSERVLVFKRGRNQRELITTTRADGVVKEVRVDFSPTSLAGYVAMTQKPLRIRDCNDKKALNKIHPLLVNDEKSDTALGIHTTSSIAVPILHGDILIGVLQLINPKHKKFSASDYQKVTLIAGIMGDHFYEELGVTEAPFDLLVRRGHVNQEQLEEFSIQALAENRSVGQVLMNQPQVSREMIMQSLSSFYQIPYSNSDINTRVPANLIADINPNFIRHQGWIPIADNGIEVTVLIDDPSSSDKLMMVERVFRGRKVKLLLMLSEEIAQIAESALSDNDEDDSIESLTDLAVEEVVDVTEHAHTRDRGEAVPDSNVVRLINKLILDAFTSGASDIHIQPAGGDRPATVLFRIDGTCTPITRIPRKLIRLVLSRLKVMSSLDLSEHRLPQDGKCTLKVRGQSLEIRVAIIPNAHGLETVVLRLLSNCEAMHLSRLNLSKINLAETIRLAEKPHGLFLVVGPTGSGKTTTLHSVVGHLNNGERIIWTIEDPVEITQPGLQQVNVNKRVGLTFARALRSFLRADPDVILVGEMRDEETAEIALQASMTGHLVLSTLHTNSAADTLNRLRSMGVDAFDLADSLLGVLSQRLARQICPACAIEDALDSSRLSYFKKVMHDHGLNDSPAGFVVMIGKGCDACHHSGYQGRIAIQELMVVTPAISELIANSAKTQDIVAQSRQEGIPTMLQDALDKLVGGRIDFREFKKCVG